MHNTDEHMIDIQMDECHNLLLNCIHIYDMSILGYILYIMFILELMNFIQKRDNLQCMVLVYFDLLLGGHCMKAHSQQ
jgi:hypothetical protein